MKIINKIFNRIPVITVIISFVFSLVGPLPVAAVTSVNLSTADSFVVLAGTAITETGTTVITGNVGLSPAAGSNITGLTAAEVSGTIYAVDAAGPAGSVNDPGQLTSAKNSLTAAYLNAAGQTPVSTIATELGNGASTTAGIYNSAAGDFQITGTSILDAQGDPNAVFIFKTASTLITGGSSVVSLVNGAQACNVFWQVGSSATLGTNSTFKGNILALTSATLTTGANVEGRVLARNGAVTLDGNTITKPTCTSIHPPVTPVTETSSSFGFFAPLPLINVTKIPSPLALPAGPGSVTYTYRVTNEGIVPMHGVWVKDNMCSVVNFVSGDSNSNALLDLNEAWVYSCTKTVSKTETNTATAHGQANGWDGYDTANATVVVGLSLTPPLIHVVKKPNVFVLPAGGGAVTYSYTVTNPGTAPLHDVSVIDNKCIGLPGRVVGHPGDLNKNNLLESNEVWSFTCQTNLTQTTTNIGTAEGHANGLTAIDFSPATVVVAPPGLPRTGIGPKDTSSAPWNILIPSGILVVLFSFFLARKKGVL